jgi:hypothetical protein
MQTTGLPLALKLSPNKLESVVLPDDGKPVNHITAGLII